MPEFSSVAAVVINVIFVFTTISYVSASATDALASLLGWRAKLLLDNVKSLLDDPNFTGLARDLYRNPLVNPSGNAQFGQNGEDDTKLMPMKISPQSLPAAIDSHIFGLALLEVLGIEEIAEKTIADTTDQTQVLPTFINNARSSLSD